MDKHDHERVAVISGAFGDVGRALCKRFAQSGFTVAALYNLTPESRVEEIMQTMGPGNHAAFMCDFSDTNAILKTVKTIEEKYGAVTVGVHAAWPGIVRKKLLDISLEEASVQYNAGVMGSFAFLQALGKLMRAQKSGALIGITTEAITEEAKPGAMGTYVSAKYALYGLLKTFARELAGSGVRVHAIAPGFMRGGINRDLPLRLFELLEEKNGPLPTPEQVAETALRLTISPDTRFSISV